MKNHSRSRITGPPSVYSEVGTTLSIRGSGVVARRSFSNGVSVRQSSLFSDSRKLPENWFPPDFVMMLTTPPLNRPNSAETPPLATVVSWIASSIAVSKACPRMFSLMLTPLRRKRFSKVTEPPNENAPAGPVGCTPGAIIRIALRSRDVGSCEIRSCEKLVAICAVFVSVSADRPVTVTSSVTCAGPSFTSSGRTCVGARTTVRVWVWNPPSENVIV